MVTSKLSQDAVFPIEDDLPNAILARLNNFDFGDLFVSWEVVALVIFESASFARLPVTQSESKRVKRSSAVLYPFDFCYLQVADLI